ncbi:hypothetical protein TNCV_3207731 [Trichonephila clavipes]|nr:hypothetical protein TNCV_3207731 [Trichonephila clavipes]
MVELVKGISKLPDRRLEADRPRHSIQFINDQRSTSLKNRDPKDNVGNVNRDPKDNVGQGGSGAYVASNGNRDSTGNVDQPTPPADVASYRNRDTKYNVGV